MSATLRPCHRACPPVSGAELGNRKVGLPCLGRVSAQAIHDLWEAVHPAEDRVNVACIEEQHRSSRDRRLVDSDRTVAGH